MSKKLFAIFAYRFDAQLVPDLIANLDFVDGFIIHDDRRNNAKWYHEGKVRNGLINKARQSGADWVICVDPDERFEKSAGKKIRKLIETEKNVVYGFPFRELWTPDAYRVDGIWGEKRKMILFPLKPGQEFDNAPLHSGWSPRNYENIMTDINLYHLKNIKPENRQQRADLYNEIDPNKKYQPIGYDYLANEDGLKLQKIGFTRRYTPKYSDDYDIVQFK